MWAVASERYVRPIEGVQCRYTDAGKIGYTRQRKWPWLYQGRELFWEWAHLQKGVDLKVHLPHRQTQGACGTCASTLTMSELDLNSVVVEHRQYGTEVSEAGREWQ